MASAFHGLVLVVGILWCISEYKKHRIRPRLFMVGWYSIYYGLIPLFVIGDGTVWNPRFQGPFRSESFEMAGLISLAGLVALVLAFTATSGGSGLQPRDGNGSPESSRRDPFLNRVATLVVLGFFGLAAFIILNGGLGQVLGQISELRSTSGGSARRVVAAFFALGRHYVLLGAIYFSILARRAGRPQWVPFLAGMSWAVSLGYGMMSGGRGTLISIFIAGLIVYIFTTGRISVIRTGITVGVAFFAGLYGKSILFQLGNPDYSSSDVQSVIEQTQQNGQLVSFVKEFTHPYLSLVQAVERSYDPRLFGDYWYWVVKPLKLLGLSPPDSISYFNTFLTWGVWDSEVPPGILAFGYLSLGSIGVLIHVVVTASLIIWFERICARSASILGSALLIQMCVVLPTAISASDPALLAQNYFPLLIPLLWVYREQGILARRMRLADRHSA